MQLRTIGSFGVLMALALTVAADEDAQIMRRIVAAHGNAVVTVKMTIKQTMTMAEYGTEESEYTQEIIASVISKDGLMVTSLLELDPSKMMNAYFSDEEEDGFETKTDVTALRVLQDGKEIDAEIVLRDTDLDLAFLRPVKKPEADWTHVDLSADVAVQTFEKIYILYRMGKVAQRLPDAYPYRISAVVEKPRKLYILGESTGAGNPIFTKSGACLGINVTRTLNVSESGDMDFDVASIVIPGPDIMKITEQVPPYKSAK
ncbi:MAG: serine protease [Candidatus Hydrogenedentes bacterium]|nr:serine protease [Candidatus Hydrogenedentota bacterium]